MRSTLVLVMSAVLYSVAGPSSARAQGAPPLPTPGPEQEVFKNDVGVWDAEVESFMEPGQPPTISKGTETSTLLGGLWLVSQFKSEWMGQPFEGFGTLGYDSARKKYVGTWVDSMSIGYSIVEGSFDPAKKTLTAWMEGPDLSGNVTRMKETTEWKDADTRIFTMYAPQAQGEGERVSMRITYRRRK